MMLCEIRILMIMKEEKDSSDQIKKSDLGYLEPAKAFRGAGIH